MILSNNRQLMLSIGLIITLNFLNLKCTEVPMQALNLTVTKYG